MTLIKTPRAHRKTIKTISNFADLNRWASDLDLRITEILQTLGAASREIATLTRGTPQTVIVPHATQHLPAGSDPLATAAPTTVLGGTSANAAGTANSFSRSDHSHDVGTAVPGIGYSASAAAEGSSNNLLRVDATLLAPTFLRSTTSASTLTLTDDAADQTLTGSLGILKIVPGSGMRIDFPNSVNASLTIAPGTTTAASLTAGIQGRATAGTRTLLVPNWFSPATGDIFSSQTFRCWDAQFTAFAGQHTNDTIVGYDAQTMTMLPSAGSGGGNNLYAFRNLTFGIYNTNATWADAAAAYFKGVRRLISSPTITTQATVIIEPPTAATSDQIGLLIRQQTAQATATNRVGIEILAQNSGTNKWSIRAFDPVQLAGITMSDATDIVLNTTTGTKIGTATTQKLSLWGVAPVVQYATTGTVIGHTGGGGTALTHSDTFTGNTGATAYTVGDLVRALKFVGAILA